ncbi:MAG: chalcone isomerase family protein [Flavobacteriaceae bacterium]
MKLQHYFFIAIVALFSSQANAQETISGVNVPSQFTNQQDQSLELNGAGVREKFWIDLYVASMYVETKGLEAEQYYNSDSSIIMNLNIISDMITSDKMFSAIEEGFENSAKNPSTELQSKMTQMTKLFKADPIKKGDSFRFSYIDGKGTYIFKNDKELSLIPGKDFKSALFGIWLCNKPADKNLKKDLLKG